MIDVYENCPTFENEKYFLRMVTDEDVDDLLKVYSDIQAVPLFNSDNCHGDDFHYETIERMKQAIDFWSFSYKNHYFVRWAIVEKSVQKAVGTIELFNRTSEDYFNNCGILRLDLSSNYENATDIKSILSLITEPAYDLFGCNLLAMKAVKNQLDMMEQNMITILREAELWRCETEFGIWIFSENGDTADY